MSWESLNFSSTEFECSCCSKEQMDRAFTDFLQLARQIGGVSFNINSGWRCREHNDNVGGTPNSSHLRGLAADIRIDSPWSRMRILMGLYLAAEGLIEDEIVVRPRIIIYPLQGFLHVDVDPTKTQGLWIDIDGTRY